MYHINNNGDLEYGFSYEKGLLRVWESCSDPHGPNSEATCTIEEYTTNHENAKRCLSIVKSNFGDVKYQELLSVLESQK